MKRRRSLTIIEKFVVRFTLTIFDVYRLIFNDLGLKIGQNFRRRQAIDSVYGLTLMLVILFDTQIGSVTLAMARSCNVQRCADALSKGLSNRKATSAHNVVTCLLLQEYSKCLARNAKNCRGDLMFLSLKSIAEKSFDNAECRRLLSQYERDNKGRPGQDWTTTAYGATTPTTATTIGQKPPSPSIALDVDSDPANSVDQGGHETRCMFPYQAPSNQKSSRTSQRYCVAFGDPHLRTFSGHHDTCRILNAWSMVDNAYLTIQLFVEPVNDIGFDQGSAITKVSIVIKSLAGCTDQKTYSASGYRLPTSFDDGTVHSGEPLTSNGDRYVYFYNDGHDYAGRLPPVAFIDNVHRSLHNNDDGDASDVRDDHTDRIDIHLRYVATRIIVRRVGRYLNVALKMPEEALALESSLSSWQLCMASCPKSEMIDYKKMLSSFLTSETNENQMFIDHSSNSKKFAAKLKETAEKLSSQKVVELCRQVNLTDFFFDACVFDLLITGDLNFRQLAQLALQDIREHYPPYVKHYQTNRSDLTPYLQLPNNGKHKEDISDENENKNNDNLDVDQSNDDHQHHSRYRKTFPILSLSKHDDKRKSGLDDPDEFMNEPNSVSGSRSRVHTRMFGTIGVILITVCFTCINR